MALLLLMLGWMMITAVVGVVVETVLRRELQRENAHSSAEPRCGRCGYIVIGLPGHVCPECGGDLHAVGVYRPIR